MPPSFILQLGVFYCSFCAAFYQGAKQKLKGELLFLAEECSPEISWNNTVAQSRGIFQEQGVDLGFPVGNLRFP